MIDDKAVATYDPDKLMDSVRARIRSEFTSLIPDQAWHNLVKKSVDSFFEKRRGYNGEEPSEFERMVSTLIHEEVKKRILEYFQRPEWTVQWETDAGKKMMSEAVEKIVKDNVGQMVAAILGNSIQSTLGEMMSRMNKGY